jgi:hypothetical protein
MQQTLQLLDYLAMQEDAVLSYHSSNMVRKQQRQLLEQAKSTQSSRRTLLPVKQYNRPTKQWGNTEHSAHH